MGEEKRHKKEAATLEFPYYASPEALPWTPASGLSFPFHGVSDSTCPPPPLG